MRQHAAPMTFPKDGSSYIILSPIELSIRRKIEAVGKPLKEWDVKIYRGVLTGCNEAFIITTEKRNELLAQCQSEEERERTAELIRPILRGRDIKRYSYDWAGLWVICARLCEDIPTNYPTICHHLESFVGKGKLGDNSTTKVFERPWWSWMQEPSYWKDFDRPKIVWGEISDRSKFAYEHKGGFIPEATTFLMVGCDLPYLLCVLNAPLSEWFFSKIGTTTGVGTIRWKKYTIQELLIPCISDTQKAQFTTLVHCFIRHKISFDQLLRQANQLLYDAVDLTADELRYIESFYSPAL